MNRVKRSVAVEACRHRRAGFRENFLRFCSGWPTSPELGVARPAVCCLIPGMLISTVAQPLQHNDARALGLRGIAIQHTIRLLRERPVQLLSLGPVAESVGVPLSQLKEVFPSWMVLLLDAVQDWNGRRLSAAGVIAQTDGAAAFLRAMVAANIAEPALSRALVGAVTACTTPGHPLAEVVQHEWVWFHAVVERALVSDMAAGREPRTMDPARGAEQLIAVYDGLQLQAMLRPEMDLLEAYDLAVAQLTAGWATSHSA